MSSSRGHCSAVPTRRRKTKVVKPKKKDQEYSGFAEPHHDRRCAYQRWGERLSIVVTLEDAALRAVGEHMTLGAFQSACMSAWQRAHSRIESMLKTEPGDPPDDKPDPKTLS
jgi:hypothetical protein